MPVLLDTVMSGENERFPRSFMSEIIWFSHPHIRTIHRDTRFFPEQGVP